MLKISAHRTMWSVTNYFLVNLTIADLLMATLNCIPSFIFMRDSWAHYIIRYEFLRKASVSPTFFSRKIMGLFWRNSSFCTVVDNKKHKVGPLLSIFNLLTKQQDIRVDKCPVGSMYNLNRQKLTISTRNWPKQLAWAVMELSVNN